MTPRVITDAEAVVKEWLFTTAVAPIVTWGGFTHIYLAMPPGSPKTSVILSRAGGAPVQGSDTSEDVARISFRCYGRDRTTASDIAMALISAVESLAYGGEVITPMGAIKAAETRSWSWSPDPESQTPRYLVDIAFTVMS